MNPNHYLAVAINYLFQHRPQWGKEVAVGKTLVSSAMIDRVVNDLGRKLVEVPVGLVVCRRPVRWQLRLRRRRERRGLLPALRRHAVVHR